MFIIKMMFLTLFIIQITLCHSAPLQLQMLQPFLQHTQQTGILQLPSQESVMLQQLMPVQQKAYQVPLLQQLLALQQLQSLQRFNMQPQVMTHMQRPLLILLPKTKTDHQHETNSNVNNLKTHHGITNEETDSIVIDAEPEAEKETQKGILLIPNEGRLGIGDIISQIPFLPIEINVPDSISWIWNGISGIISGIGQSWPSRPQVQNMNQGVEMTDPQMKTMIPVLIMPLSQNVQG